MNKTLIIIDAQYDFINGSLAVDGAENTMNNLAEYLRENGKSYTFIILTADWHPKNHCSFKTNGGIWPNHCVQFTQGAAIYQPLIDALDEIGVEYAILTKGLDPSHEEYSILKNKASNEIMTSIVKNSDFIDFVGIAFDYCVKDSAMDTKIAIENLKPKMPNIQVLKEFCPSIGNPNEVIKEMENNGIKVIL